MFPLTTLARPRPNRPLSRLSPLATTDVYLPIPTIIQAPRTVDPKGRVWNRIVKTTGQHKFWTSVA